MTPNARLSIFKSQLAKQLSSQIPWSLYPTVFPLKIEAICQNEGKEKRNPTNFRRNQFPISRVGKTVMGFRIATSAIRPTYQLHRMAIKTVCVVTMEVKTSSRSFRKYNPKPNRSNRTANK
jgi:hypothetical protein